MPNLTDFVMLAPAALPNVTNIKYPCYVQTKLDGYRAVYIPSLGFYSRNGKEFRNKHKLNQYFNEIQQIKNCVFDGEFYIHGLPAVQLASYLNKEDADITGLRFIIYDCIPIEDWIRKTCKMPYSERLILVRQQIMDNLCNYDKYRDIINDKVYDARELIEIYKEHLKDGYEGCIIRSIDSLYQWKRVTVKNGAILKLKPFDNVDLEITGVYEGELALEGTLGGITCNYNGSSIRIGSGFNLSTRREIWNNQDRYIGKTAEIKYSEMNENGLKFPIFVRIRDDK